MARETKKKNRLSYMILSVVIAIIAWVLVTYITDPDITKTISGVRIELTGESEILDKGYVITNRNDLPKLSIKMRGKRSDLIKALDKTRVVLDVSKLDKEGEFAIETTVKLHTSRITVERISEAAVPVTVAKIKSRDIPIRIIQTGELEGRLVKTTPVSETVAIKGVASELDMIDAAEVTVDISGITESGTMELGYVIIAKDGVKRDELTTLKIPENLVTVNNIIYEGKELPVKVVAKSEAEYKLIEKDTKTDPETVWVGVDDSTDIEELVITLDENADEGEYKLDKYDGVYIPSDRKTIYIKPVWEKKN